MMNDAERYQDAATRLRLSPFGMTECAICDGPATVAILTERNELIPHCATCATEEKAEIPDTRIYLLPARAGS